jgi:hypothetical protein
MGIEGWKRRTDHCQCELFGSANGFETYHKNATSDSPARPTDDEGPAIRWGREMLDGDRMEGRTTKQATWHKGRNVLSQ